jgi:hypothetical protein
MRPEEAFEEIGNRWDVVPDGIHVQRACGQYLREDAAVLEQLVGAAVAVRLVKYIVYARALRPQLIMS